MFSNICLEKSGKPAATDERRIMLAATVDAALLQLSQLLSYVLGKYHLKLTAANYSRRDS